MNCNSIVLSVISPTAQTMLNFLIIAGLFLLIAIATLVWFFSFRNKKKRKRKRHSERRPLNPTLAQTRGLPPVRQPQKPAGENPPPLP